MGKDRLLQLLSFSGGILSRTLDSRVDAERAAISARVLNNVQVLRNGSACNRAGFEMIGSVKTPARPTRVIDWIFDDDDRYCIELGETYFRFYQQGARIVTDGATAQWDIATQYNIGDLVKDTAAGTTQVFYCCIPNVGAPPFVGASPEIWHPLTIVTQSPAVGIYEVPNPYAAAHLFDTKFAQSADVVWFTHPTYPIHELKRSATTTWTMIPTTVKPPIDGPSTLAATGAPGAISRRYKITSVRKDKLEESLPGSTNQRRAGAASAGGGSNVLLALGVGHGIVNGQNVYIVDVYTTTGTKTPPFEAAFEGKVYAAANVTATTIELNGTSTLPAVTAGYAMSLFGAGAGNIVGTTTGSTKDNGKIAAAAHGLATGDEVLIVWAGSTSTPAAFASLQLKTFIVTVIDANNFTLDDSDGLLWTTDVGTLLLAPTAVVKLATSTSNIILTWDAVPGAEQYYVYKELNGVFGYVQTVSTTTWTDQGGNAVADTQDAPPRYYNPFRGVDKYPSTVTIHDQRLCFGGTNEKPADFWMSKVGDYLNFTHATPIKDDDSVNATITGAQELRHLLDFDEFVAISNCGIYFLLGDADGAITPTTIKAKRRGRLGASGVAPLIIDDSIVFVESRRAIVRDFRLDAIEFQKGRDLTTYAPSLFDGFGIVQWAFQRIPQSTLWAVRDDGVLLGLTYVREQEIAAWHTHDSGRDPNGYDLVRDIGFESVAVVPEDGEDALYAVVHREVNPTYEYGVLYEPPQGMIVSGLGHWPIENQALAAMMGEGIQTPTQSSGDVTGGSGSEVRITSFGHGFVNGQTLVCVSAHPDATSVPLVAHNLAFEAALFSETFVLTAVTANTFDLAGTTAVAVPLDYRASFVVQRPGKNLSAVNVHNNNVGRNGHGGHTPGYPGTGPNPTWYTGSLEATYAAQFAYDEALGGIPQITITLLDEVTVPFSGVDVILDTASGGAHPDHDKYLGMLEQLTELGKAIGAYNKPLFLCIGPECNGPGNGYDREHFASAFAKARAKIRAEANLVNVLAWPKVAVVWILETTPTSVYDDWYPGDAFVDYGGFDIFYSATNLAPGQPNTLHAELIFDFLEKHHKPLVINESGAVGQNVPSIVPDAAHGGVASEAYTAEQLAAASAEHVWAIWFKPYFDYIRAHPSIKIIHYINRDHSDDAGQAGPPLFWLNARIDQNHFLLERWVAYMREGHVVTADSKSLLKSWRANMGLSASTAGPTTARNVEWMKPRKAGEDTFDPVLDAYFVDSGVTWDGRNSQTAAWVAITLTLTVGDTYVTGDTATLTASASLFVAGDVDHTGFRLVDPFSGEEVEVIVRGYTSGTVVTVDFLDDCSPQLAGAAAAVAWVKMVDTVAVPHLEGRILNVLADGIPQPTANVANGIITLQAPKGIVRAGLPITADIETLDLDVPGGGLAASGVRPVDVTVLVHNTRGATAGPVDGTVMVPLRETPVVTASETTLFTGKQKARMQSRGGLQSSVRIRQSYPLPMLIEGLYPNTEVTKS